MTVAHTRAPTEGQRLVAAGAEVDLGGTMVRIRFDNRALVELERRWGSLKAFVAELEKGQEGRMFTCLSDAISACVRDLPADPIDLMEPARFGEYAEAVLAAFEEAMPSVTEADRGNGRGPKGPSRGAGSSSSRSSAGRSTRSASGG